MTTRVLAWATAVGILIVPSSLVAIAEANAIQLAQIDIDVRIGPPRSPDVLVEEPRPPSVVIETEGRGERRNCRSVTVTEWQDGVKVTRTEQQCDR